MKDDYYDKDNHVWENHTIINKSWKNAMLKILGFFGCMGLMCLFIPAFFVWFFSLGHFNFFRVLSHILEQLSDWLLGYGKYENN